MEEFGRRQVGSFRSSLSQQDEFIIRRDSFGFRASEPTYNRQFVTILVRNVHIFTRRGVRDDAHLQVGVLSVSDNDFSLRRVRLRSAFENGEVDGFVFPFKDATVRGLRRQGRRQSEQVSVITGVRRQNFPRGIVHEEIAGRHTRGEQSFNTELLSHFVSPWLKWLLRLHTSHSVPPVVVD